MFSKAYYAGIIGLGIMRTAGPMAESIYIRQIMNAYVTTNM